MTALPGKTKQWCVISLQLAPRQLRSLLVYLLQHNTNQSTEEEERRSGGKRETERERDRERRAVSKELSKQERESSHSTSPTLTLLQSASTWACSQHWGWCEICGATSSGFFSILGTDSHSCGELGNSTVDVLKAFCLCLAKWRDESATHFLMPKNSFLKHYVARGLDVKAFRGLYDTDCNHNTGATTAQGPQLPRGWMRRDSHSVNKMLSGMMQILEEPWLALSLAQRLPFRWILPEEGLHPWWTRLQNTYSDMKQ